MRDFFVLDTMDMLPRSDMATLEHPIYSLSTKPERRRLSYANGDCRIELIPSSLGLPTVFDKDIIIYAISKLMRLKDDGAPFGPIVRITTRDMLVETNRPTNNLGYERLLPALNRLKGVVINTTITTGNERTTRGFGLIDEFEYNRRGSMFAERLRYLEIKLSDWIFRAITSAEVLPISREYFRLRAPVDRRLYEIARKHCGRQSSWRIGLELLQRKVGSKQAEKHFHAHLRKLVRSNHLPDYAVTVEGEQAVFYRRAGNDSDAVATSSRHDGAMPRRQTVTTARRHDGAAAEAEPLVIDRPRRVGACPGASEQRRVMVSSRAIEQLADVAPRWDRHLLESLYIAWAADKEPARNEDARFLAWAASYTKGKPA